MSEGLFDGLGPFADGLTNAQRGKLASYLTKACLNVPDARPAALLLADLTVAARRDQARQHLNAMGSIPRRHVLAAYQRFTRNIRV